jgi:beta-glucanase (GH16 family)
MVFGLLGFSGIAQAATGCEHHHTTQGYRCIVEVGVGMCLHERNVTTFAIEACAPRGTIVYVIKQVRLKSHPVNGTTIWDILDNGRMISDDYINTGRYNAFSPPIPNPSNTKPASTPTASATGTLAAPPTATTSSSSLEPVGQSGSWKLLFHDEFTNPILDASKWNTCYENFHLGQDCTHDQSELELYQPSNVSVSNGVLTLEAYKQQITASNGQHFQYTSGMISSGPACDSCAPHFTFTYGYMEMRAKVPAGQGLWPAFWTLPADGSWPPEIDAFEILGNTPNQLHMTYHWPDGTGEGGQQGQSWSGPDFSAGWHTFAVDWEPESIIWYVDGVQRFHYANANVASKPMYLVANLAVGGDWPGAPDASTPFPARYQIDYIRVWEH